MLPIVVLIGLVVGAIFGAMAVIALQLPPQPVVIVPYIIAGAGGLGALFAVLYWQSQVPLPARTIAFAHHRNHDVLELVTHDNKSYFIRVKSGDGIILEPVDRAWKDKLIIVTTPDAATPIHGSKTRLIRAIVDHPVALDPTYIAVVVDFRRKYGFESLAELLESDRYYGDKAKLEEQIEMLRTELDRVMKGEGEYAKYGDEEREQIRADIERQLALLEKLKGKLPDDRPFVVVRGRIWTADDVLGWLGYRMPGVALRQLAKLKETEGYLRGVNIGKETMKYGLIVLGIIALVVIALILKGFGGAAAPPAVQNVTEVMSP